MNRNETKTAAILAGAVTAREQLQGATVDDLIARIQSDDDKVRGAAWQGSATVGAAAIKPLAALLTHADFEVARSAKRALYRIVRHAGRPGARSEAKAVEAELVTLLKSDAVAVRREMLWLLSEIGNEKAIAPMAALLADKDVREDARCALMRLPGRKVTAVFKAAFANAPETFKFALAESLRQLGASVAGYPSQALRPTREAPSTPQ